jgi:hypothetical protein
MASFQAIWVLGLVPLLLFNVGCATDTAFKAIGRRYQESQPATGKVRIVVFAKEMSLAPYQDFYALVNGSDAGLLEPYGFIAKDVDPGEVTVAVRAKTDDQKRITWQGTAIVEAQADTTRYFQAKYEGGFASNPLSMVEVSAAEFPMAELRAAASQSVLPTPSDEATDTVEVTFVRGDMIGTIYQRQIFVDGDYAGELGSSKKSFSVNLPIGTHEIVTRWAGLSNSLDPNAKDLVGRRQRAVIVDLKPGTPMEVRVAFNPVGDAAGTFVDYKIKPQKNP